MKAQIIIRNSVSLYQRHVLEGLPRAPGLEALRGPDGIQIGHQVAWRTRIGHPGTFALDLHQSGEGLEVEGVVVSPPLSEGGVCTPSFGEGGIGWPTPY